MAIRLLLFVILIPGWLAASETYPYEWEKGRQRYKLSVLEEKEPEIILKEHYEYAFKFEDKQFVMYSIHHRIVRVNTSEAIQRHNRISIPMDNVISLVDVKARSINAQNVTVLFDANNLKAVNDPENGAKVFAMEGVELGGEIEYYFIRKMAPLMFGSAYLQMDVPVKQSSFALKCPRHLVFEFKSYNGFADVKSDTTNTENIYFASMDNVPPLREEAFAYHIAQRKRIEFKLAFNRARSKARLYTWDDAGKQFYNTLFGLKKDDEKALEKFVKGLKDDPSKPLPDRIRHIERTIKTTIQLETERSDASLGEIASIVKYKVASKYGMTRLLLYSFSGVGIQAYPVITCNREFARFDETFDTWSYLDDYVIAFPQTNGFLAPYDLELHYPLVGTEHITQKGLMIEPVEVGSMRSGLATIRDITATPHTLNTDNLDIAVGFSSDLTNNVILLKRQFKGYNARYVAPYYDVLSEQQKTSMVEDILTQTAPGMKIEKWEGMAKFDGEVDQFDLSANVVSSHFIERAGPRILFKLGLLIGPQSELYQDDKRHLAVENSYNRGYERIIKVTLPPGYSARNLNDIKFDVSYSDGTETPFSFQSSYAIEGQVLTVKIDEYYKDIHAPLERYEDYRKVINAAADFNKVVLVLEKK